MKALVIGNRDRYEKYMPDDIAILKELDIRYCPVEHQMRSCLR